MDIEYLNAGFVLFIHTVVIDEEFCEYGGQVNYDAEMRGIKDTNLFNSALLEPKQSYGGKDLYPDIISKAACYLRSFSMNHPFFDGNKRTALMSMIIFLEMNGYKTTGSNEELYQLVKTVVEERMTIEQIVNKIKPYIRISKIGKLKQALKRFNRIEINRDKEN